MWSLYHNSPVRSLYLATQAIQATQAAEFMKTTQVSPRRGVYENPYLKRPFGFSV